MKARSNGASRTRRPSRLAIWLKLAIVALAVYLAHRFVAQVGWREVAEQARVRSWPAATLALGTLICRFVVWGFRLRVVMRRIVGLTSVLRLQAILFASVFVNHVTVSARFLGGLMRARYLARDSGRSFSELYGAVFFDQLANQASVASLTVIALLAAAWRHDRVGATAAGLLIAALLLLALAEARRRGTAGLLDRLSARLTSAAGSRRGLAQRVLNGSGAGIESFRLLLDLRLITSVYLLGLLSYGMGFVAQWAVFRALGVEVPLSIVVSTVALGSAAGALTGTPGGVGTTEAAMLSIYSSFGIEPATAAAATLGFRGLHYAVVIACGLPALAVLELGPTPGRHSSAPAGTDQPGTVSAAPLSDGPRDSR